MGLRHILDSRSHPEGKRKFAVLRKFYFCESRMSFLGVRIVLFNLAPVVDDLDVTVIQCTFSASDGQSVQGTSGDLAHLCFWWENLLLISYAG